MAQGGHGWPSGPYRPNAGDMHDGAGTPNERGLAYDTSLPNPQFTTENNVYMSNWPPRYSNPSETPIDYSTSNFANHGHSNPSNLAPEYYFEPNQYSEPVVPEYGQPARQNGSYEQFNQPQPAQNPQHLPDNFVNGSWQPQTNQHPQSQFGQTMTYDNGQGLANQYHQQLQAPTHISTPPAGLRAPDQYPAQHRNGGQLTPQPANSAMGHYPLPGTQAQFSHSPYQSPAAPISHSPIDYHNQVRFVSQQGPMPGQVNISTTSIQPAPQPIPQPISQPISQLPAGSVKRKKAALQKTPARTNSPVVSSVVGPPATHSYTPQPLNSEIPLQPPISDAAAAGATPLSAQIGAQAIASPTYTPVLFDPAKENYKLVEGSSNLYSSDMPVELRGVKSSWTKGKDIDIESFVKGSRLLPTRPQRLPCEIQRDWKWWNEQKEKPEYIGDVARKMITSEMGKLDKEMVKLTGNHGRSCHTSGLRVDQLHVPVNFASFQSTDASWLLVGTLAKKTSKKTSATRKTKATAAPKAGADSPDSPSDSSDSDSEYEESEEVIQARKVSCKRLPP
jgi:hypothetical protein